MKIRKINLLFTVGIIILSFCLYTVISWYVDKIEAEDLKAYTPEEFVKYGYVVNMHEQVDNIEKMDAFIDNFILGKPDKVKLINYTDEGDPIINTLDYDGEQIEYTIDSSLDKFAGKGKGVTKTTYKMIYRRQNSYCLVDDKGVSEAILSAKSYLKLKFSLQGQNRSDKPAVIKNRLVLPSGDIQALECNSFNYSKSVTDREEVSEIIDLIEKAQVIEEIRGAKYSGAGLRMDFGDENKISLSTTYDGQYIQVFFHGLPWINIESFTLKSPQLAEKIHEISRWEQFNISDVKDIEKIVFRTSKGQYTLKDQAEILDIVKQMEGAEYYGSSNCPFGYTWIDFFSKDQVIHGVLAGDDCPMLMLQGNEFDIGKSLVEKFREIIVNRVKG